MKNKIIATLLLCISTFASAGPTATATNNQTQTSTSAASTDGNQQQINIAASVIPTETTQNVNYGGTETVKNVPSVSGPNLTSSNDTCMGSTTGSANAPGFGVSLGTTWADTNCRMLKNSRELWNMGMKAASLALMCTDPANKAALELTGFECPQTTEAKRNKLAIQPGGMPLQLSTSLSLMPDHSGPDMSDPIIAARVHANSGN